MARNIKRNQVRMDSVTEQLPTKLTPEEEQLVKLAERNTKFDRDELVIPRLKILQPLNPEVQEGGNQYISGAKAGMFYNTSSGKLTPGQEGMIICIVGHQKQVIEWYPRSEGMGRPAKIWGMDEGWKELCEPDQLKSWSPITRDGHIIDQQRSFLIFDVDMETGAVDPSFFNLHSTGVRVANHMANLVTQARAKLSNGSIIVPPYYYYLYKLSLDFVSNPKGKWWAPKVVKHTNENGEHFKVKDVRNGDEIFKQAVLFQEHFLSGDIRQTDFEEQTTTDDLNGDRVTF